MESLKTLKSKPELKKLTVLIKEVDAGKLPLEVRTKNDDFLKNIKPLQLALAEQSIIEKYPGYEYKTLLEAHIELLDDPAAKLRKKLLPDHYIRKELMEHEMISSLLVEMDSLKQNIYSINRIEPHSSVFQSLTHIATHFSAARKHFEAEEKVLFDELEKLGIYLYPKLLREEHNKLQILTYRMMDLLYHCESIDFSTFRIKLTELIDEAIPLKRKHIYKEDNMLYPIAYELIDNFESWQRLSYHCDLIGYCCF